MSGDGAPRFTASGVGGAGRFGVNEETGTAAISRGTDVHVAGRMAIGGFALCTSTGTLFDRSGNPVTLGYQATRVLEALAGDAGQVVSKDRLMSVAWGNVHVTENNLVQCIRQIRHALGDRNGRIVKTVPKVGYMLLPGVAQSTHSEVQSNFPRSRLLAGVWALLAVGIAVPFALYSTDIRMFDASAERQVQASAKPAPGLSVEEHGPSIIVVPFVSISGDERSKRLGLGMAMELSGALARHSELRVIATSAETVAASDPMATAGEHSVRLVMDGTILAQGETLQVSARLSDASDNRVLWSQVWRGQAGDIFDWQDEALARILSSISAVWTGAIPKEALRQTRKRPTESLDAYELFLLGSAEKHEFTKDSLRRAVDHLERSTEIDPGFARAWVALDLARVYLSDFADTRVEADALFQASLDASRRAFEADPEDPQVLVRYSALVSNEGDLDEAARLLRQAVREAPNDADILAQAAFTAAWRGITGDEPVLWAARARELNPSAPDWYDAAFGMALFHAGRFEEAALALSSGAAMNDATMVRAAAEALAGNLDAARNTARELRVRAPGMVAMDLVPGAAEGISESWGLFLEGARIAGVAINSDDTAPER
jgi:TolB-like protein/DNA-binding winged helix-turn-helix (wHTH) protein